jgi:transcription factor C subunit 6
MPDEHYILKHNPIRRFYHNIYSMRSESSIVRVAASPVHPGVLVGGANGTVIASNPVVRVVNTKNTPWQQNWFVHEWRGPVQNFVTQADSQDGEMTEDEPVADVVDQTTQEALSKPLARITEGYKATQPGIQHSVTTKRKPENEISTLITVFEEKSSITSLAWNPNLKFGTWAVAGMGDGLLRVEDIGV